MKVTICYDVMVDVNMSTEVAKELYEAYTHGAVDMPLSVYEAIEATPEWQALTKLNAEFALMGVYNPDWLKEGNEMPETEVLWEE